MSLITSCPSCGTMFRVVPDQLKISEGWVRCGHCSEVFDATANLAEEAQAADAEAQRQALPSGPQSLDDAIRGWEATASAGLSQPAALNTDPGALGSLPAELASAPAALPPRTAPSARAAAARVPAAPTPASPRASARDLPLDSQAPEPTELDAPFVFRRSDFIDPDATPSVYPPSAPRASDSRLEPDDEEAEAAALQHVSFVRQARRKAFWGRPSVRFFLALMALALALLLALQYAWQDRDRLALAEPQLRPALEFMCDQLFCTLGPPRQIESVVIESSGFNRLRNDSYKLSFALRNNARTSVAMPSLELTLTDSQDQPLLRRVLAPADLGARDGSIAAGADWSGAVGIVVNTTGGGRVAGYRLLAFYP